MQEYWFCESCKSMNRATADRCYRCHAPRTQATLVTVAERAPGVVLIPELDEEHRQVAWTLMARQTYISAWQLGYVAAGLLLVACLAAPLMLIAQTMLTVSGRLPADASLGALVGRLWFVIGLLYLGAIVVHSIFLGLTTMDTPALGSGSARFATWRAFLWWIESTLWALRGGLAFVVPVLLAWIGLVIGGLIFGLIIGGVWFWLAIQLLGDPVLCLGKPKRLIEDLWQRLAVRGSADARLVSLWAMAWGVSRGFAYAVSAFVYVAMLILLLLSFFGYVFGIDLGLVGSDSGDQTYVTALAVFVAGVQLLAEGIASLLLVEITLELASRQRTRERWVTSGLGPAQGGPAAAAMPPVASAGPPPSPPSPPSSPWIAPAEVGQQHASAGTGPAPAAPAFAPAPASEPRAELPLQRARWIDAQAELAGEEPLPEGGMSSGSEPDRQAATPATNGLRIQRRPVGPDVDSSPFARAVSMRGAAAEPAPEPASEAASEPGVEPAVEPSPEPAGEHATERCHLPPEADWPEGL